MRFIKNAKTYWENIWMPQIPAQQSKGKSELELERDRQYETKWVWYHTILEGGYTDIEMNTSVSKIRGLPTA